MHLNGQLSFTVMTCNVGNRRANPNQLIPVIRESRADLVGIQELSDAQAAVITDKLSSDFPFQVMYPGGFAGKAVLSRFPIIESQQLHLSSVRPDLLTKIDIGICNLTFIVAHPPPPRPHWSGLRFDNETWNQITILAELTVKQPSAVLLGDFNLVDWWGEYAYLRSVGLHDAFQRCGKQRGHTLPKRFGPWKRFLTINRLLSGLPLYPMLRVDYIWYTDPLQCQHALVGADTGSDHLPVLAHLVC